MLSNSNDVNVDYKCYDAIKISSSDIKARAVRFNKVVEDTAIQCSTCDEVVIAEYNFGTRRIEVFEYDPYIKQEKLRHLHPAGPLMRKRIESRIDVETRLLHSFDEGDFHVLTGRRSTH